MSPRHRNPGGFLWLDEAVPEEGESRHREKVGILGFRAAEVAESPEEACPEQAIDVSTRELWIWQRRLER